MGVDLQQVYETLVTVAEELGVEVRVEPLRPGQADPRRPRGGLVRLRGRQVVFIEETGSLPDRIASLCDALSDLPWDALELPPIVRATLSSHRRSRAVSGGRPRPLARAKRRTKPS